MTNQVEPPGHDKGGPTRSLRSALVAFLVFVAACGAGADPTTTSEAAGPVETSTTTAAPTETTVAEERVPITMWVSREQYQPTPSFYDSLAELHPNIDLTVELQPADDLFFQLIRMSEADQPLPDIVHLDDYFAIPLAEAGLNLPLNDLITRWQEEDPDGFALLPEAAFTTIENGDVVAFAPTATIDVIYFRADWFEEAGVELPLTSWDAVLNAARAVKEARPDSIPWAMTGVRGGGVNWLITMMSSAGVEFDGAVPSLESPAGLYVLGFLQAMVSEGLTSEEALAWGEDETRGAFIGGQAAMTYDGIRSSNELGEGLEEQGVLYPDGWSLMAGPTRTTDGADAITGRQVNGTRTFHITSESPHPYEASLVLRLYASTDQALAGMRDAGLLPMSKDILGSPEFFEAFPYISQAEVDALQSSQARPADVAFFQIVELLEQMIQDILQNPDQPTEELAANWQAQLDEAAAG